MSEALSRRVLAAYSGVSLPLASMAMPISVYLPPFYGGSMGLSLTTVGTLFLVARVWDVVTDPLMGLAIDRFDSPWGRRKHWLALALPILLIAVWHVFLPNPEKVSATYLGFWLFLLYVGYTMMLIAHQAWGADLTAGYDARSRLFGWRELFVLAGMVGVLSLPALVEQFGSGSMTDRVASMGWYCVIAFPIATLLALLLVPDRRLGESTTKHRLDWSQALSAVVSDRTMRRLLLSVFTIGFNSTASAGVYVFLVVYVFELPRQASIGLLAYFLSAFLAMPLWMRLAYRLGKDRSLRWALIYGAGILVALLLFAGPGRLWVFWPYLVLYGVAYGAGPTLLRSMMADLVDADELETGRNRGGLLFSLLTSVDKLGSAVGSFLSLAVVERVFGFSPGADNADAAIRGVLVAATLLPLTGLVLGYLPLHRYPMTRERHGEIQTRLAAVRTTDLAT
ncbi:MAG: MFS transporter [Acidobacteriota bacterium]